jgi:thiamine-monophosphate kinase
MLVASRRAGEPALGAVLDAAAIPVTLAARRLARGARRTALDHALGDGEDYELLVAVRPHGWSALVRDARLPAAARHPIGCVRRRPGIWLRATDGTERRLEPRGYEHVLVDHRH